MNSLPDFDKTDGLLPVIAQDYTNGEVLMLAWQNRQAWESTLREGVVFYWSRSRQKLWKKGEISGHIQIVKEILIDCDRDSILIKVEQIGEAACHTGRRSCFYRRIEDGKESIISEPLIEPEYLYGNTGKKHS